MADTKLPSTATPARGKVLAFAAAASLMLGACLQTDPGTPEDTTVTPPKDTDRRAGASSSTNWPAELATRQVKVESEIGSELRLKFGQVGLGADVPVEVRGTLRFHRAGVIPALEGQSAKEFTFPGTDTVSIPFSFLDTLWNTPEDTLSFNIEVRTDTLSAWVMGFAYSKSEKKVVSSPLSNQTAIPFLRKVDFYFVGNLSVDTTLNTPVSGTSEFCFYIPGTPIFGKVQADRQFKIGPLPQGEYPLRLLRLTKSDNPRETLVEAWEVPVDQRLFDSSVTPGAKVLSVRTQGILNLRNAE